MAALLLGSIVQNYSEDTQLLCLQTAEQNDARLRSGCRPAALRGARQACSAKEPKGLSSDGAHATSAGWLWRQTSSEGQDAAGQVCSVFEEACLPLVMGGSPLQQRLSAEAAVEDRLLRMLGERAERLADLVLASGHDQDSQSSSAKARVRYADLLRLAPLAGYSPRETENAATRCRSLFVPPAARQRGRSSVVIEGQRKAKGERADTKDRRTAKARRKAGAIITLADFAARDR
ncbi:hypothetical protein DFJ74DRAFT_129558 [Hyaloraphidium curvatum]|nr:hypothetical protein DFJ74DRAFT_129558 [Hyaloraphidium curvatum]